jgi:electron transfer flavoprotein beta subunit
VYNSIDFYYKEEPLQMKILVCIKQVADTESNLKLNSSSSWIVEDNKIAYRMNRYDEYALEEALIIKDILPGTAIDVISVGPERAAAAVKKALEKGADNGIHIKCGNSALTAIETSSVIAEYAKDQGYDIIFAGVMSEDLMQSQVGPMIASFLSIPSAVSVVKTELVNNSDALSVYSELEGGMTENIEIKMPCLITVQTGINLPRYPSLSNVMRARSMEIVTVNIESLKITESYEEIVSAGYPPASSKGVVINGTMEEKAEKLLGLFHEKALI